MMGLSIAFALLLLSGDLLLPNALGCSLPPGGCERWKCKFLEKKSKLVQDGPNVGFWLGSWSKRYKRNSMHMEDGPFINYEVYTEVGHVLKTVPVASLSQCCFECAKEDGCYLYQFFDKPTITSGMSTPKGFKSGSQCYLLKGGSDKTDSVLGAPFAGEKKDQRDNIKKFEPSWVGGLCNGNASVVDDPHFTGAMGTKFDFNGRLDRSFCLTADRSLQINVLLRGYEDSRSSVGATEQSDGKALRSWIKEVGLIWRAADGTKHTAHLVARNGKEQGRGPAGFLSHVEVDGVATSAGEIPRLPGEKVKSAFAGFEMTLVAQEKHGAFDVDHFTVRIPGHAEIDLRMRVAHPALQSADDSEAHFNIQLAELKRTADIHGVLGQTFRTTEQQMKKALKFSQLVALLKKPVVSDGESGKGFLEGEVDDYITTDVLSPDCKFSTFSSST